MVAFWLPGSIFIPFVVSGASPWPPAISFVERDGGLTLAVRVASNVIAGVVASLNTVVESRKRYFKWDDEQVIDLRPVVLPASSYGRLLPWWGKPGSPVVSGPSCRVSSSGLDAGSRVGVRSRLPGSSVGSMGVLWCFLGCVGDCTLVAPSLVVVVSDLSLG